MFVHDELHGEVLLHPLHLDHGEVLQTHLWVQGSTPGNPLISIIFHMYIQFSSKHDSFKHQYIQIKSSVDITGKQRKQHITYAETKTMQYSVCTSARTFSVTIWPTAQWTTFAPVLSFFRQSTLWQSSSLTALCAPNVAAASKGEIPVLLTLSGLAP